MTPKDNTIVVLFNYGGGMRGLIPAHIMTALEEKTGLAMADMVDVFCGPSTGAILNAALNIPDPEKPDRPRWKARHMVKFYEREGIKIFPPDRFRDFRGFIHDFNNRTMKIGQLNNLFRHGHYKPKHLSRCLHDLYGDAPLSSSLKNLVVPVFNINGEQLELTREDDENEDMPAHTKNNFTDDGGHALWLKHMKNRVIRPHTTDVKMHDAILASCAAPTYFPCHHFEADGQETTGIDGSIFDNPCISYHGAIGQHVPEGTRVIMILLGTGHNLRSFSQEDWNSFGGLGVVDPVNDLPLINILFHATETALIDSFKQELGDDLFVFNRSLLDNDPGTPSESIDDASEENLKKMKGFAHSIMDEPQSRFDDLCQLLVQNTERKPAQKGLWQKLFG